jgi:Domain of Unknown Function (DUF1080)
MKISLNSRIFRAGTARFFGISLTIGVGLSIVSWALVAQQPQNSAEQSQPAAAPTRADGMPANFPFNEPDPMAFEDHTGYLQIFDGVSLKGWDGDPSIWRVENGAIVGEHPKDKPLGNTYLAYRGFEAKDFDLKLEIKVEEGGGSGIQYRSKTGLPWHRRPRPGEPPPNLDWMMTGPQADFWGYPVPPYSSVFSGQFYSENTPLGIVAWRGQVVQIVPGSAPRLTANIGDRTALGGYVKYNDWNELIIIARGGTLIQILNGQLMSVVVDDDATDSNNQSGLIGIEIENSPSKVSVRNVWIKKLQ